MRLAAPLLPRCKQLPCCKREGPAAWQAPIPSAETLAGDFKLDRRSPQTQNASVSATVSATLHASAPHTLSVYTRKKVPHTREFLTQEISFSLVLLQAIPEDIPLDVVYEDAHLIVVNKVRQ